MAQEHHGRGSRKIVKTRIPGSLWWNIYSCSYKWLEQQNWNNGYINRRANSEEGKCPGVPPLDKEPIQATNDF